MCGEGYKKETSWLLGRRECVGRTGGAESPLKPDPREAAESPAAGI